MNQNPRFLIKSGYYIVPNPSTALPVHPLDQIIIFRNQFRFHQPYQIHNVEHSKISIGHLITTEILFGTFNKKLISQSCFAVRSGKKVNVKISTVFRNRPLKALNDTKMILTDWRVTHAHLGSIWYYSEPSHGLFLPLLTAKL